MDADNGGTRFDAGKTVRYDLIAPEFLEALAQHTGEWAQAYEERNWERGMPWNKPFVSMMRHAWKWFKGESLDDFDTRVGTYRGHHLIAAAWNCMVAYTYETRGIGTDNRPVVRKRMTNTDGAALSGVSFMWGDPAACQGADAKPEVKAQPQVGAAMRRPTTFWYLATPYTHFPAGHTAAALLACRLAAQLMRLRVPVFSPIAHSHYIAEAGLRDVQVDHDFWMHADQPLMAAASGLIVVMAESWRRSRGMAKEIERFRAEGKPVMYWDPDGPVPNFLTK